MFEAVEFPGSRTRRGALALVTFPSAQRGLDVAGARGGSVGPDVRGGSLFSAESTCSTLTGERTIFLFTSGPLEPGKSWAHDSRGGHSKAYSEME